MKTKRCKRIYFEHNGERSRYESAWTWICSCGAEECGSTKEIARDEWRSHKKGTDVYFKNKSDNNNNNKRNQ